MKKQTCKQCGYVWLSKLDKPKQCPRCKRYDYDKEEKKEVEEE